MTKSTKFLYTLFVTNLISASTIFLYSVALKHFVDLNIYLICEACANFSILCVSQLLSYCESRSTVTDKPAWLSKVARQDWLSCSCRLIFYVWSLPVSQSVQFSSWHSSGPTMWRSSSLLWIFPWEIFHFSRDKSAISTWSELYQCTSISINPRWDHI